MIQHQFSSVQVWTLEEQRTSNIFRKIWANFVSNLLEMEPRERIERCLFQWERILLKFCGHNFIGEPFKPNIITYTVYALISSCIVCEIYSIAFYDKSAKLFCTILFLLILQVNKIFLHCFSLLSKLFKQITLLYVQKF